jgi:hypothetical protein
VPEEEYYIYKLLTNIIYFSDSDIIYFLRNGVKNYLFNDILLNAQINANFELKENHLQNIIDEEIGKSCFMPLLFSNLPHESGNYILRLLVQNNIINSDQSVFPDNIENKVKFYNYQRIIIVDDCIGTGEQLIGFWTDETKINDTMSLCEWTKKNDIEVIYLVLFGYKNTIENLKNNLSGIKINCLRELDDSLRVFHDKSYIWKNKTEKDLAMSFFYKIIQFRDISLYGYKDLDFAFIMDKTIPDWSLPMFWKNNHDWIYLLSRKNSNV